MARIWRGVESWDGLWTIEEGGAKGTCWTGVSGDISFTKAGRMDNGSDVSIA